jgi:hypothetical protein
MVSQTTEYLFDEPLLASEPLDWFSCWLLRTWKNLSFPNSLIIEMVL